MRMSVRNAINARELNIPDDRRRKQSMAVGLRLHNTFRSICCSLQPGNCNPDAHIFEFAFQTLPFSPFPLADTSIRLTDTTAAAGSITFV
jgi:hypothetical protein